MAKRKPAGYWQNKKNVLNEMKKIIKKHKLKTVPTASFLKLNGYGYIIGAIQDYPHGLIGLREDMGYSSIKPAGYYKNPKNIEKEILRVMDESGLKNLPSGRFLENNGRSSLGHAITQYYPGKYPGLRKKLRDSKTRLQKGYWKNLDNVLREATIVLRTLKLTHLPSKNILQRQGYYSLANAIGTYQGGFPTFREQLKKYLGIPSENKQLESMLEQYAGGSNEE